ncbi:MAG: hypothetical protein AB7F19_01200 [Candidatus Babeliales bacterium]
MSHFTYVTCLTLGLLTCTSDVLAMLPESAHTAMPAVLRPAQDGRPLCAGWEQAKRVEGSFGTKMTPSLFGSEVAPLLPQLTTVIQRPIPCYGMHSGTSVHDALFECKFQAALQSDDPIIALEKAAEPLASQRTELIAGSLVTKKGTQYFPLIDFARGIKLLEASQVFEAENALRQAVLTCNEYRSHEEPIFYASQCTRYWSQEQYQQAFSNLLLLQNKALLYPCWQPVAHLLCTALAADGHLPAIKQLADAGDVEAQQAMVNALFEQALEKKIKKQLAAIRPLAAYCASLVQDPTHSDLGKALTCYMAAIGAYEEQNLDLASACLIELLASSSNVPVILHVQQLGRQLLDKLATIGDLRATCFGVQQQLSSKNKTRKAQAVVQAEALVRTCMQQNDRCMEQQLKEFGLLDSLVRMAEQNQPTVCTFWAEWACKNALSDEALVDDTQQREAYKRILRYAKSGLMVESEFKNTLQIIQSFAQAVFDFYAQKPTAARQLIDIVNLVFGGDQLTCAMRDRAEQLLERLVEQKQVDACCVKVQRMHTEQEVLSEETIAYGIQIGELYLAQRTPSAADDTCLRIRTALDDIARRSNNAQAKYLLSRLLFRLYHEGCEQTGLAVENRSLLDDVVKLAGEVIKSNQDPNAAQQGSEKKQVQEFTRAVMLYRGILALLEQADAPKKADVIVKQLLDLLTVQLPSAERKLVQAFAKYQMMHYVQANHQIAGPWYIADLLCSDDKQKVDHAVHICTELFEAFLGVDYSQIRDFKTSFEPFRQFSIVAKIEKTLENSKYKGLHNPIAYLLAHCYVVQALVPCRFIDDNQSTETQLLEKATAYCKKAFQDGVPAPRAVRAWKLLDKINYVRSQAYLRNGQIEKAKSLLAESAGLEYPTCMRACAMLALEQPREAAVCLDKQTFDAHVLMLERAYELGDKQAGAILAEHYYDGRLTRFACGNHIEKDLKRALELAVALGDVYPQTARILGFLEFYKVVQNPKNKGRRVDLSRAVTLLMQSARDGQKHAYRHLEEIVLSEWITQEVAQIANDFIVEKAAEHIPEALCALAGIFLADRDQRRIEYAIQSYEDAIRYSDGRLGHMELANLYCRRNACKAAQHCLAMIELGARDGGAPMEQSQVIGNVLGALLGYQGAQDDKAVADTLREEIITKLARLGIEITTSVQAAAESPAALEATALSMTVDIAQAMETDPNAFSRMQDFAESNPYAQHTLSLFYLKKAKNGSAQPEAQQQRCDDFLQAIHYASRALTADVKNENYKNQLIASYYELYHYYRTVLIPQVAFDQESLNGGLGVINKTLEVLLVCNLPEQEIMSIKQEAAHCIRNLASCGCVQAMKLVLATQFKDVVPEVQQESVQVVFRGCHALSQMREEEWESSGVEACLDSHIEDINKIATTGNGHASFIVACWMEHKAKKLDKNNNQRYSLVYLEQSVRQGCIEAQPILHMTYLLRDSTLSAKQCAELIAQLECYVRNHGLTDSPSYGVIHFVIKMYRDGMVLPCRFRVSKDMARAKELALRWKNNSGAALMTLATLAQEENDLDAFFDYAFRLYQIGLFTLDDMLKFCVEYKRFPKKLEEYAQVESKKGKVTMLRALCGVWVARQEYEKAIAWCTDLLADGFAQASMELVEIYLNPQFAGLDIERALTYLAICMNHIKEMRFEIQTVANVVNQCTHRLLELEKFAQSQRHEKLKIQVSRAMDTLVRYGEEFITDGYESVEFLCIHIINQCAMSTFDFKKIVDTFERVFEFHKIQPHEGDVYYITNALKLLLAKHTSVLQGLDPSERAQIAESNLQMKRLNTLVLGSDIKLKMTLFTDKKKK